MLAQQARLLYVWVQLLSHFMDEEVKTSRKGDLSQTPSLTTSFGWGEKQAICTGHSQQACGTSWFYEVPFPLLDINSYMISRRTRCWLPGHREDRLMGVADWVQCGKTMQCWFGERRKGARLLGAGMLPCQGQLYLLSCLGAGVCL